MPANRLVTPQNHSFSLWNIFGNKAQSRRETEKSLPLLTSVVSVSPSHEHFNLPEMENGKKIRSAAENLENDLQSTAVTHNSSGRGWKITATIAGVVGIAGSAMLYLNHMCTSSSRSLMPVDKSLTPIFVNPLSPYPIVFNVNSVADAPKTAALQARSIIADRLSNEISMFRDNFYEKTTQQILDNANSIDTFIRNHLDTKGIPAKKTLGIGKSIAGIIRTKIEPMINNLNVEKDNLNTEHISINANFAQLRILCLNRDINNAIKAKEVLSNLVAKLNRTYLDYLSHAKK